MCLVGCKAEVTDIVRAMFLRFIVSQLSLDSIGAKKGMGDKRTGQTAGQNVIPQLQAQIVPIQGQEVKVGFSTVESILQYVCMIKSQPCLWVW